MTRCTLSCSKNNLSSERMWFMLLSPVPADPGPDDLAWLDRDPERDCWLDRAREHDEPPEPGEEEYEDFAPISADELAGIEDAASHDLLAVEAVSTGRRGPGQPGSARVFPGRSSSRAASFGPGMAFDVMPGCAQLAVAAAAAEDDQFDGVSEAELIGVMCAWDRVEAHAAARKLAVIAEVDRRNPKPEDAEFTADEIACALAESRWRADELMGTAGHLDSHLPRSIVTIRSGPGPGASRHDPGVKLRHLAQVRHATCTSPICRRPAAQADFEHNTPYEAAGRTCLCNGGPPCKR
jgi:hypothetical protein